MKKGYGWQLSFILYARVGKMSFFFLFFFFFFFSRNVAMWIVEDGIMSVVILTMGQKQDINSKTMSSSLSFDIF